MIKLNTSYHEHLRAMVDAWNLAVETDDPGDWEECHSHALIVFEAPDATLKHEARFYLKTIGRLNRLKRQEAEYRERARDLNRKISQYNKWVRNITSLRNETPKNASP